jgi:hypothetical protein
MSNKKRSPGRRSKYPLEFQRGLLYAMYAGLWDAAATDNADGVNASA